VAQNGGHGLPDTQTRREGIPQDRHHVVEVLFGDRLALMAGPWGTFIRFAQANEAAVRDLAAAEEFDDRMDALAELLRPTNTIAGRIEARLALGALFMADARKRQLGGSDKARTKAALATALRLVADPAGRDHTMETD
jgi:hypothetical protein